MTAIMRMMVALPSEQPDERRSLRRHMTIAADAQIGKEMIDLIPSPTGTVTSSFPQAIQRCRSA
jgi:hypothetical protein